MTSSSKKFLIFLRATSTGIPGIIGLAWVLIYLVLSQNIQEILNLFIFSFLGGLIGGLIGPSVVILIGLIADKSRFISKRISWGDPWGIAIAWLVWIFIFWIIDLTIGAVLGGLIFIRIYS